MIRYQDFSFPAVGHRVKECKGSHVIIVGTRSVSKMIFTVQGLYLSSGRSSLQ
jgi:hypothetical protein